MIKSKAKRGFTLVELLIVVGIITVLISLLLPALSAARRQANAVACSSNLRQIGQWALMYTQEWNGYLPSSFINGGGYTYTSTGATGNDGPVGVAWNTTQGGWGDITSPPYFATYTFWTQKAGPPYNLYIPDPTQPINANYGLYEAVKGATPLRCPEAYNSFPNERNGELGTTYAMNEYLGGQQYFSNAPAGQTLAPLPKASLLQPTVYWFCDAGVRYISTGSVGWDFYFGIMQIGTANTGPTQLPAISPNPYPWCWDFHDNPSAMHILGHPNYAANFLFGDGHVEPITRSTYQKSLVYYNTSLVPPSYRPLQSFTGAWYP